MNKAGLILEKIARLTRVIRLKRHLSAIADAVGAMSPTELLQLRGAIESVAASIEIPPTEQRAAGHANRADGILDELSKMSFDRQLNFDSAIVRIRYIARWLMQAVHLTVGDEDPDVRTIYRKAVAILRSMQAVAEQSSERSWFLSKGKKAS